MTTMWRMRRNGAGAGWPDSATAATARARAPSSATATIAVLVRGCSGAAIRASLGSAVVGGDDHRLEGEVVAGLGIGRALHPVDVGAAEGLQPGEVRDQVGLVDERLVELEEVRVAVDQHDLAAEGLRLGDEGVEQIGVAVDGGVGPLVDRGLRQAEAGVGLHDDYDGPGSGGTGRADGLGAP